MKPTGSPIGWSNSPTCAGEYASPGVIVNEIEVQLHAERAATVDSIEALTRSFTEIVTSIEGVGNDDEHDPEGATIGYERALVASLLETARTQLQLIDDALTRIGEGHFGVCTECGRPVGLERLRALPTTSTCIGCAR